MCHFFYTNGTSMATAQWLEGKCRFPALRARRTNRDYQSFENLKIQIAYSEIYGCILNILKRPLAVNAL
jgi:hypothetical protein